MPISKISDKIDQYDRKKSEKPQQPQPNHWVTNGPLGSKDSLLIFRTSVLAAAANTTTSTFDHPDLYSETPSTSSTCTELSKVCAEKSYVTAMSLPQNLNGERRIDNETFNFNEKKTKKRSLESSSSTSSSSSLSSGSVAESSGSTEIKEGDENKENIVLQPLDRDEMPAALLNITFKFLNTETRLLRKILLGHGLTEAHHDANDFNLLWTGNQLKPDMLRSLSSYQRINHFPRSSELTRKDRLYKNIERMQHFRGFKHFDIVPQTFLLPADYKELVFAHNKNKGPWIVKPVASSRGRGIFLAKTPDEIQSHISSEEQVVVARYIADPLCIDGHKCDIRIYVAVTSFDPLIIYVYEEGLVRIATVRYDNNADNLWNPCMHLCNYSINKYHTDYIKSSNVSDEDVGHKWTFSALLRHLRNQGCNTEQLMLNIEDIIIKAIFACTQPIVSACRMFVNHVNNCFELFGFDILIDDTLKPWLIEVNLSPSLGCDSPLDTKVKASLLSDLLTLVGIPAISPLMKASMDNKGVKIRSLSSSRRVNSADFVHNLQQGKKPVLSSLTAEEIKIVKAAKGQMERRGGFVRIFPAVDSMQKYGMFMDPVTGIPTAASTTCGTSSYLMIIPHNYNQMLFTQLFGNGSDNLGDSILDRIQRYERTLDRSLPIVIGPKSSSSKHQDETKRIKMQIRKLIESGDELSTLQARRAFSLYLEHVLKRLSVDGKHSHEEYVMKFLHRIAIYMRQPFFIRNVTSNRILTKEKGAMAAKLLGDYLHLYNKDTEAFVDSFDRMGMVPTKLFDEFISHAQELDIESLLTLHTNITQTMPFLYNNYSPGIPAAPPIPVGPHGFLKALPCMAPGSHVREFWRSDGSKGENKQTKVHNKKAEKPGKISPTKKKISYSTSKLKDRDRSSWLYN